LALSWSALLSAFGADVLEPLVERRLALCDDACDVGVRPLAFE
jgi:hypothetical protein